MNTKRSFLSIAMLSLLGFGALAQTPNETKHPGEAVYTRPGLCSTCHQITGQGIPGAFPPLLNTDWVTGDPIRLIKIVDKGLEGKLTINDQEYNSVMPAQGGMITDQELTDVLNFIRSSWGNDAADIPLETVSKVRAQYKDQEGAWDAAVFQEAVYETGNSLLRNLYGKVYHGSWSNYVDFTSNAVVTAEGPLEENLLSDALAPPGDDYAYEYTGKIIAPDKGTYSFLSQTKLPQHLWIDGQPLLKKEKVTRGIQSLRASLVLTKGEHDFRLVYINAGEREPIALSWTGPKISAPMRALSRRKTGESTVYPPETMLKPENGEAVMYRNFIKDSGPRSIAVGYPDQLNMCFDAEKFQWSLLWRGEFINGGRHWTGRGLGDQLLDTGDVVSLPKAAPFALLENAESDWPTTSPRAENYSFRGYVLDHKRFPSFHYEFGDLQIEEKPLPQRGEKFFRQIRIRSASENSNLYFLAASGLSIKELTTNNYLIDERYTLTLFPQSEQKIVLRSRQGKQELIVHCPLELGNSCLDEWCELPLSPIPKDTIYSITVEQEYAWKH